MEKHKLKKGDRVWVRLSTNATILRVNKQYGYTLKTDDGNETCYFDDNDVVKIEPEAVC